MYLKMSKGTRIIVDIEFEKCKFCHHKNLSFL